MDDIKQMAVKLSMLIDSFERRGEHVDQVVAQAAQSMMQASKYSEAAAERTTSHAVQEFRQAATTQLGEGLRGPVEIADQSIRQSMQRLQALINACELRQHDLNRMHQRDAWKVFVACTLGSLVMLGASVYAIGVARKESANASWVSEVNAAIATGKLAPCVGDGLCAVVRGEWTRVDRGESSPAPAKRKK